MARNTLEAVFGALGAGLTGFGRERQQRTEDEERRRREALQDSLTAANMLASGRFGTEAQLQASGGNASRTAGQLAAGAMPGGAPRRVLPSADELSNLGTAARRGPAPTMFEVGGQRLGVMRTAADETREAANRELQAEALQREQAEARDIRAEGRALERFRAEQQIRTEGATKEIRERATAAGRSAGLSPNDRAYQAVLQFARTPIETELGLPSRLPTDEEVQQFAARAKTAEGAIYRTPTSASPIVVSGERTQERATLTRQRDEALREVDARPISAEAKARAKARIEAAYQTSLAQLAPR